MRGAAIFAGGLGALLGILVLAAVFVIKSDWGMEALRDQAEQAVQRVAGDVAVAGVGPARIVFTADHPIALQLQDISLTNSQTGERILTAARIDFGIRLLPLLRGTLQLGSAKISDAQINVAAFPRLEGRDWMKALRDERGLVDPDMIPVTVFKGLHSAFDAVNTGFASEVRLENVNATLLEGETVRSLRIAHGALVRGGPDTLAISASIDVDGRLATIDGSVREEQVSGLIAALELTIDSQASITEPGAYVAPSAASLGGFSIRLAGQEDEAGGKSALLVSAMLDKSSVDLGARGVFTGNLRVDAELKNDSNKIEISRLLLETGRNTLEFNGAFGPRPAAEGSTDTPLYRYEFISTKTVLAPDGSREPPIDVQADIEGTFDALAGEIATTRLAIRTGKGEANGSVKVNLVAGQAPGIALAFSVRDMQVASAKQIWPWFVAGKARAWALDHLFGGILKSGQVDFRVEPGRLGNGVPLSDEEIVGRYKLEGTRLDTAGKLPPIRDASGAIDIRGHDVTATLASGTVYLPSGRSVKGSNGTLTVGSSDKPPVIGKLDVDVEGDAAALAEFASFEPVNAMRFVPFAPEDLSGAVKGHVIADIPLQKGVDLKTLEWIVALDYSGLSISKPIAGQSVTDATGKMTIEPAQATISATAKLNGSPATIVITEPLRPDGPRRQRRYELVLDDDARQKLAPGLDQIVSGVVKVGIDEKDGVRQFAADLTNARLDLPWVGWSKGPGIPAKTSFKMDSAARSTAISDFSLDGDSFAASGTMSLAGGGLATARFDHVRLNRGDDFRVKIDRSGKSYKVEVAGDVLDARAIVKRTLSDSTSSGARSETSRFAVALALNVAKVVGFNGETLSRVKLAYDANGASIDASLASGGALGMESRSRGGARSMRMQAADAGSILRFLDLYRNMQGGTIKLALSSKAGGPMTGQVDARNFVLVDEPRLASMVSTPAGSGRSLNQAVRKEIDVSRVPFERGFAEIERSDGYLKLANAVVRGPDIGMTFQGTLYDAKGQMDMTGTFMPAYGLNRLFGELPLVGALLGNGRDGGLIGVTFKLEGDAKSPLLEVNPLSVIAPGIFRQIFEYD